MIGPDLGPNVEAFYNLKMAGVTRAHCAEAARLFVDQVREKANVAAIKRLEDDSACLAWALGETLKEWQKRAKDDKQAQPKSAAATREKRFSRQQLHFDIMAHLRMNGWQTEEQIEDAVRGRASHNEITRAIMVGLVSGQITTDATGSHEEPVRFRIAPP